MRNGIKSKQKSTFVNEGVQRVSHWVAKYRSVVDTYEEFVKALERVIYDGLKRRGVLYPTVTGRAKDVLSFREKIRRPGKYYANPLEEITDLAGIRVIVLYEDEIDVIQKFLNDEFVIDSANSVDKRKMLDHDRFGYRSAHMVVSFTDSRLQLTEYSPFRGMKAEVQVRTVLQHAWAAVEHMQVYKSSKKPTKEHLRRFTRLASLLEIADDEFVQLRRKQKEEWAEVGKRVKKLDFASLPIDRISLGHYFENADVPKKLEAIAKSAGVDDQPDRIEDLIYRDLLGVCDACQIRDIAELHERLANEMRRAKLVFKARNWSIQDRLKRPWQSCREYLASTILIVSSDPLPRRSVLQDAMDIDDVYLDSIFHAAKQVYKKRELGA